MRAKFVNETIRRTVPNVTCTVDEFFSWYAADYNWYDDWQVTNTMSVNGKHAQDDGQDGQTWLDFLKEHQDEQIEVVSEELSGSGDWELSFDLLDRRFSLQSITSFAKYKIGSFSE